MLTSPHKFCSMTTLTKYFLLRKWWISLSGLREVGDISGRCQGCSGGVGEKVGSCFSFPESFLLLFYFINININLHQRREAWPPCWSWTRRPDRCCGGARLKGGSSQDRGQNSGFPCVFPFEKLATEDLEYSTNWEWSFNRGIVLQYTNVYF